MKQKKEGNLLCAVGIHRPLTGHVSHFVDGVSRKQVYTALCSCEKTWIVDSTHPYLGDKVEVTT